MSEEILKALMQLFAIIAKQDTGLSKSERDYVENFLRHQLNESSVKEYLDLFDFYINEGDFTSSEQSKQSDSSKTLEIAEKINNTLDKKQKIVVLVRLFEFVNSDKNLTPQRISIIKNTADIFNICNEEYKAIDTFILEDAPDKLDIKEILFIESGDKELNKAKRIQYPYLEGTIIVLKISSANLYFLRYTSNKELLLNGLPINNNRVYLLARGSVIKQPKGMPIFYTDIVSSFRSDETSVKIHFKAENIYYEFPDDGNIGLNEINIEEESGKMLGILGASGAGKTTLLNIISGIEKPTIGKVSINGIDLHKNINSVKGIIGHIPQDDLLIEELTVYENLYYSTKLVYKDLSDKEIKKKAEKILFNLGLLHIKDLKVGNPLNIEISGGQRKRLNIGLELIREPSVLFVDEPTSGLSSNDSANVMELLRELTVRGKLIFVVIHQPSSEIFKMFDNITILDEGGYQIYYGNPIEAVIYFKELDNQIDSHVGECPSCGSLNPETIFSIIESKIIDEYGQPTVSRKTSAPEWFEHFKEKISIKRVTKFYDKLPHSFKKPNWLNQFKVYFKRDLLTKISNKQYLALNLLEAPLLAFLLAFIIKYIEDPTSNLYIFRDNDNIMPYIFMCTIVALFLGLIVSAEEIFKDKKILKRESFLNLSRSSYLCSKIGILFIISAIQSFSFVLIGNYILEIKGMNFEYFIMFFSIAAFANILGLNISSAFNSAITIYIIIPFLIIPQMILTGAMFNFDKINSVIGGGDEKVPIIAEFVPSRWAFEGLVVNQYKNNKYYKNFYNKRNLESELYYKNVYYITELKRYVEDYKNRKSSGHEKPISKDNLQLLRNEIKKEKQSKFSLYHDYKFEQLDKLYIKKFNPKIAEQLYEYLDNIHDFYNRRFNHVNKTIDDIISDKTRTPEKRKEYLKLKNSYHNKYLSDFVKNKMAPLPLVRLGNNLVQKINPIYLNPPKENLFNIRSHFLAPKKHFAGNYYDTFYFNLIILWLMTIVLYITLYFKILTKLIYYIENGIPILNQKIWKMRIKLINFLTKKTGI